MLQLVLDLLKPETLKMDEEIHVLLQGNVPHSPTDVRLQKNRMSPRPSFTLSLSVPIVPMISRRGK